MFQNEYEFAARIFSSKYCISRKTLRRKNRKSANLLSKVINGKHSKTASHKEKNLILITAATLQVTQIGKTPLSERKP